MVNALALGQAEVLSHLGQPLHISVPLRATTEELWTTEASIASKEEFELLSKINDGRAQWSNWGGLNDVLRNQEFSNGLAPSNYTFGGVLGSTNINTRASQQRAGTRISYASSNRSYQHRVMATHSTGMMPGDWALTVSASRRAGQEGFTDGTSYNAYSLFTSFEKKFGDKHSINFTSIFAPNRR